MLLCLKTVPKIVLKFEWDLSLYCWGKKLRICGFAEVFFVVRRNNWVCKTQICKIAKKYTVQKLQIRICWRSANLRNKLSSQICGFAIGGTYLRTAQLWTVSSPWICGGSSVAESKEKHGVCMGPYAGVDYNLTWLQSRLQHIYHGQ